MANSKLNRDLFHNELEVLEDANRDIESVEYKGNVLLDKYKMLAQNYYKLLKLSSKVFNISDKQGRELSRCTNEIRVILDNSNQGFLTFNNDLVINKEYSTECIRIFGRKISGWNVIELLGEYHPELKPIFDKAFKEIFIQKDQIKIQEVFNSLPSMLDIDTNYINFKYKLISSDNEKADKDLIMIVLTDITEKRKVEDQILYLSYHDKLTSLYNRAYIESIIPQLQIKSKMPLSIILADMNGLKLTNDVFGHSYGDKLLIGASKIFLACTGKSDIVARWGGDEYLIILPNTDISECQTVYDKIKKMCNETEPNPIQISVALGAATMDSPKTALTEILSVAENNMYSNKVAESKLIRSKIIQSLETMLHSKCYEDSCHVTRLRNMLQRFSKILGIKPDSSEMDTLLKLTIYHDIGKVAIPKEILGKNGKLSEFEWNIMRNNTQISFRMAQSIDEPALANAILAFRENWNGSGYPYGISGDEIPYVSRIASIVDVYDVLTHNRPYRKALSRKEAINELKKSAGIKFDPNLTNIFINNIDEITSDI